MSFIHWSPLIEGLLEAVWLVDPKTLRITAANTASARLLQVDINDLAGVPVSELTSSPEDLVYWQSAEEGAHQPLQSETLLKRSDGSTLRVYRRVSLIDLPSGDQVFLVAMQDKTQQHLTEQRLETLLLELRATLESTADGILVCDLDGHIRAFNRLFAQLWGLPDALLVQKNDESVHQWLNGQLTDPATYQRRLGEIQRSPLLESNDILVLQSGKILERLTRPQLARGRPIGRVFVFRDITEKTATEAQLKLAAKVFESSLDAIFITDPLGIVLTCNPAAQELTLLPSDSLQGVAVCSLFSSPHLPDWRSSIQHQLAQAGFWEGELWHHREDMTVVTLQASWVVLRGAQGQALNTVLFVKDLSEKIAAQQRIEQLAYTDALTGLPNRLMLTERVNHAIRLAQRSGQGFAMCFLDLDRFKSINDSLGHLFGDLVLTEMSQRLRQCLRQTDTLCRLGGDEFVIHLHDTDAGGAEITAQRIIEAVARPVEIDGMHFTLSCSLGIALYPQDAESLDELIRHADTAMYQVKDRGKGHYRFYQPQMNADLLSRIQLDHALREGLPNKEFVLHYQPRASLRQDPSRACEALVRWKRPGHGLVMPGEFITVAEETGFIVALGHWVMEEAIRQARVWLDAGYPCQVAVNVSALQFQQLDLVSTVADLLATYALPARWLELELTESILIHDAEEALGKLEALEALGVHLALDDFGTGFSSLTYLKRFPLHKLKIDRSFIASVHENGADEAIVAAMIQMGHALNMEVVAEGVERTDQLARLQALGCDHFQGFLFKRGLPEPDMTRLLQAADWA
jgi:diguanylate cyclase (GGDEF)-like protein/PAS domain S-box-containing protein